MDRSGHRLTSQYSDDEDDLNNHRIPSYTSSGVHYQPMNPRRDTSHNTYTSNTTHPGTDDYSFTDSTYYQNPPHSDNTHSNIRVASPSSFTFQHPAPAYGTRGPADSHSLSEEYYDHNLHSVDEPLHTTSGFARLPSGFSAHTEYDPHHDFEHDHIQGPTESYPMHTYHTTYPDDYKFDHAFVPNVYDDDDEEREYDEHIPYNDFHGDSYELNMIESEPTPEPELLHQSDVPVRETNPLDEGLRDRIPDHLTDSEPTPSAYLGNEPLLEHQPHAHVLYGTDSDINSPFGDDQILEGPPDGPEVLRSRTTTKKVQMINGNLVLDCPVAPSLTSKYRNINSEDREFQFMRYQAVTCGPSNFARNGFSLRQLHYRQPRHTELMVVVTMYNEDDVLLAKSLKGVFKNIKYLTSRSKSSMWGKDSWKKIVVCVVSDGRSKINERAQALLAALGVYQEGFAKSRVNDKEVKAHIYEYTTRVGISTVDDTVKLTTEKTVPIQLLFCLKEKNAKKINSHRWCFQALGEVLQPKYVVLLDAGTQPTGKSLYHLWKEFDSDPQVAGACGEIKASLKAKQILTNPLVYGQNFEYKISNILDKPTESVFGFISVLPGAFSAYRFVALQNDVNGRGPLEKYYKGEFLHGSGELDPSDDEFQLKSKLQEEEAGIFTSNMYLAEDRILCYELVAKRGCNWVLRYVKSASAETDVPEGLAEFILQRRRWLNGSFFAAIYSLAHFPKLWWSSHSILRQLMLHIEFIYQFLSLVVSWFSLSSYFLVFRILTTSLADSDLNFAPGNILSVIFLWLYLASLTTTFVLSFGNTPKGTEKFYVVIVIFFAILMAYMIFAAIFMAVHSVKQIYDSGTGVTVALFFQNETFRDLVVSTSSTYALYFVASFLYFEPWHMFTSFAQYILLSPAYVNVLNIYAFCNIDDVSWGTKGDTGAADLGHAKISESGKLEIDIPTSTEEIDRSYLEQLTKIKDPLPPPGPKPPRSNEDYYAFIRSMTVLVWMFSNFVVVALVLETGGFNQFNSDTSASTVTASTSHRSKVFLTVILWIVAFMALFRFIGCVTYLVFRLLSKVGRR